MKKSVFVKSLFIFFLILFSACLFSHFADTLKPSFAAENLEYKVVPLRGISDLEEALNKYAAQGWRLVEIDDGTGNIIFEK